MKQTLSIYTDKSTVDAIKMMADAEDRSLSAQVNHILKKAVKDAKA